VHEENKTSPKQSHDIGLVS